MDSLSSMSYYTVKDVNDLKQQIGTAEGDIDIFLSNDWPDAVCRLLPEASLPSVKRVDDICASVPCKELAVLSRPRYHFAAGQKIFFARIPYTNPDIGTGSHVTRFISLGDVGNAAKQKWLHALQLVPASQMSEESFRSIPPGSTKSPYVQSPVDSRKRPLQAEGDSTLGEQSWRWADKGDKKKRNGPIAAPSLGRKDVERDRSKTIFVRNVPFRATEEDLLAFFSRCGPVVDVVRRTHGQGKLNTFCHVQFAMQESMEKACQLNGTELMGRPLYIEPAREDTRTDASKDVLPVAGCWFCLSNPNADVQLVASVSDECYLALDKGAITDRHVLIVPVEHHASSLEAPISTWEEIERYISSLRSCFANEGKSLVGFERFMRLKKSGGNHCHINAIAVPLDMTGRVKEIFEDTASRHGFGFLYVPPEGDGRDTTIRGSLKMLVGNQEYFMAILPDGGRLIHPISYGERHPLNFGREVLSMLVGAPERADWKACKRDGDAEVALTESFKTVFKAWDIMAGE